MFRMIRPSARAVGRLARLGLLVGVAGLAACAIAPMGAPIPSTANIARARAAALPPMALGQFSLPAGKGSALDSRISIRSNTIHSPYGSSFAAYLRESLAADLRAAGLLDPASNIVIAGELVDSRIDVPVGTASAALAARFTVTRAGAQVYTRELRSSATWNAAFMGVEAVPMALNHYGELYRQLVGDLFDDPAFQAAVRG